MTNKTTSADHLLTTAGTPEHHAEAILRAAGSSLRHYTMPGTRQAILDAVREAMGSGWQGIESAPKDRTEVQLWGAEGWTPKAYWCAKKAGWYEEYWDADWNSYSESSVYQPTHWRPLPLPPSDGGR